MLNSGPELAIAGTDIAVQHARDGRFGRDGTRIIRNLDFETAAARPEREAP
jgi:hypothetical protein